MPTDDNQILVGGFERRGRVVQIDQKDRRQGRPFDGDPHDAEIVRRHCDQHGENKQVEEREKQSDARQMHVVEFSADVADGVERSDRAKESE